MRKCVHAFNFLAFDKGNAHRIISRSIDILRVCPGVSRCTRVQSGRANNVGLTCAPNSSLTRVELELKSIVSEAFFGGLIFRLFFVVD